MVDKTIHFNGIDGTTGEYLLSLTPTEAATFARGEQIDQTHIDELRRRANEKAATLAPIPGVSTSKLDEAGWGVIFPKGDNSTVKLALEELLAHRRHQAGDGRYYEFDGDKGWRPNEDVLHFLKRHGSGPGPVDPAVMPYYLLIIGGPEEIPFSVQYQLDVQHAVGRLQFDDVDDYARYAHSVVLAEESAPRPRTAALVGVQNPDDPATELSATKLVAPLVERLRHKQPLQDWNIASILADNAYKADLLRLLGGDRTPTFLFTASHGMGFPKDYGRLQDEQGALLCQDWPGPETWRGKGAIPHEFYLAASDIADGANLLGTIAFHFACFGAGTPLRDDFAHHRFRQSQDIAPRPFVAKLPKRLLGHPNGGALAVIGHVERAWRHSVEWEHTAKIDHFLGVVQLILEGIPVGAALDYFNVRYAELSSHLTKELDDARNFGKVLDDFLVADLWTANNDARSYVILGDPAVRLKVGDVAADVPRPAFGEVRTQRASPLPSPMIGRPGENVASAVATDVAKAPVPDPALDSVSPGNDPVNWFDGNDALKDAITHLANAVTQIANKLTDAMQDAVSDASSTIVTTYVSSEIGAVSIVGGKFEGPAEVRVITTIAMNGDIDLCIPGDTDISEGLWTMHAHLVERAQAHRTELLTAAVNAATEILELVRSGQANAQQSDDPRTIIGD